MPSVFLSHQGILLPLKIRFPKKFDGSSLVFGSIMVDFEYVLLEIFKNISIDAQIPLGHSFVGIFSWVIPISIFCAFLWSRWIGPAIAIIVQRVEKGKGLLTYLGFDQFDNLKSKRYSFRWLGISYYSAMIGAFSHLLLDLPSHEYIPWFHPFLLLETLDFMKFEITNFGNITIGPITWKLNLSIYNLVWLLESLLFGILCIVYMRKLKTEDLIKKWYENEKK